MEDPETVEPADVVMEVIETSTTSRKLRGVNRLLDQIDDLSDIRCGSPYPRAVETMWAVGDYGVLTRQVIAQNTVVPKGTYVVVKEIGRMDYTYPPEAGVSQNAVRFEAHTTHNNLPVKVEILRWTPDDGTVKPVRDEMTILAIAATGL